MTEYIEITLSDHVWPNHSFINLYIVVILVKISNANNINGGGGDGLLLFCFRRPPSRLCRHTNVCISHMNAWYLPVSGPPTLSPGHPGSFTSVHDLKCMRTQTAPLFNIPRGNRGTTTRAVNLYPRSTCPSRESNPDRRVGRPTC